MKIKSILIIALLLLGLGGCAQRGGHMPPEAEVATLEKALAGEMLLGRQWQENELPEYNLFSLTPEMKRFAEDAVKKKRRAFDRAQALQQALLKPTTEGGRGLVYSAYFTETPAVAFHRRQVNCVSFTLMYVAMAHHVGLKAHINEVDLPPSWDLRTQDAYLFLRHINTKVQLARKDEVVIDLEMQRYSPAYNQRYISEDLAAAQFYNNRGMELSTAGDKANAFLHLRKALLLDDQQSYLWSNLATLYRREGQLTYAEAVYLHGLAMDKEDLTIMSNLSALYQLMGDQQKADYYFQRAERHRAGNPYYQYGQAISRFEQGDTPAALKLIRRAIKQQGEEPRFYALAEQIYLQLGNHSQAALMRQRREQLELPFMRNN